jgi:hypothetical protein
MSGTYRSTSSEQTGTPNNRVHYRDIRVPMKFWKIVVFERDGELKATGLVASQIWKTHSSRYARGEAAMNKKLESFEEIKLD